LACGRCRHSAKELSVAPERPLRAAKLLPRDGGKKVEASASFKFFKRPEPAELADLAELKRIVESGGELPARFYSSKAGHDADPLLKDFGVLHVHLGGSGSDTLLFLMQYVDRIVLLETNSHNRFSNESRQLAQTHRLVPNKPLEIVKKPRRPLPPPKPK